MEALIFWGLVGDVLAFNTRQTKCQAREAEADANRRKGSTLQQIQDENRRASCSATASHDWKRSRLFVSSTQSPHLSGTSAPSVDGRLRFIYEDSNGNTLARKVSDFSDDGVYIEGYCHSRKAVRTFRRDLVVAYLEDEELLVPMIEVYDFVDEPFADRPGMEILFTGFSEDERFDLEIDAEEAGLVVRKTVTKNLMFVLAHVQAPRSLPRPVFRGGTILDKSQLRRMLWTGIIPGS
ncbi:hypothetical protein KZO85_04405 [Chromohalobacter canadensis]|uniref:hypothetical protein n=1 Tax=Chromohalobacter canadensis TaxID=141389 RepID=UPI0021C17A2C|nr:hypothetical protein [Chromohalobacter canadensis]MCT8467811.1 hypothetical protein [Chromohalobacter canadensis]MCT8470441.1 hypothetical protein [Chromohalobacter canadensis]MCT8498308.1 hypothetical protein [Chromohalobacter canadensis]